MKSLVVVAASDVVPDAVCPWSVMFRETVPDKVGMSDWEMSI